MIKERKITQMAAFFLAQQPGRIMSQLKLMKLLYLADREAVRAFGWPISGDCFELRSHGPVLTQALLLMKSTAESQAGTWRAWILETADQGLSLCLPLDLKALDELAPIELEALTEVWTQFGKFSEYELSNWLHQHCNELKDPVGPAFSIEYESVARAVGYVDTSAKEVAAQIKEAQSIDRFFASLG